jgi:predicted transcriptional regulator
MAEKMIQVQFSVPRELRTRLERYAAAHDMTLSDCIREAIAMELARPARPKSTSRKFKSQQS